MSRGRTRPLQRGMRSSRAQAVVLEASRAASRRRVPPPSQHLRAKCIALFWISVVSVSVRWPALRMPRIAVPRTVRLLHQALLPPPLTFPTATTTTPTFLTSRASMIVSFQGDGQGGDAHPRNALSTEALVYAAGTLKNASTDPANQRVLIEEGAVPALIKMLSKRCACDDERATVARPTSASGRPRSATSRCGLCHAGNRGAAAGPNAASPVASTFPSLL